MGMVCFIVIVAFARIVSGGAVQPIINRILDGEPVKIESYPFMVSLQLQGKHICGGSIINEQWILTAAHCFSTNIEVESLSVRSGSNFKNHSGHVDQVKKYIIHEDFYSDKPEGKDIALVELKEPLIFDNLRKPIKLFNKDEKVEENAAGDIPGWGKTGKSDYDGHLQKIILPVLSKTICDKVYDDNNLGAVVPGLFCAGLIKQQGRDTCKGDSGGPFIIDGRQAGIVSWGIGCGVINEPGFYTNVAYYRDWIDDTMKLN